MPATVRPATSRPPRTNVRPKQTLAIDVGGTGLKATVLDATGQPVVDRVRVPTAYPCPPERLVADLAALVAPLPRFDRVSVGFPGVVRGGVVRSAPHFVTKRGPGTKVVPELRNAWDRFDLATALADALRKPVRVTNDADLQGSAVVRGTGLEVVVTLGTGLGSAVFSDGRLSAHLELAHHPCRRRASYNEYVGEAARKKVGDKKWNRRVVRVVDQLYRLFFYDHLYVGGGNSRRVTADLGPDVTLVDNSAGLLGGIKLWSTEPR